MSLKIEPRREVSRPMLYVTPLLAVALTMVTGFFIFLFMGYNPFLALYHFFISPLLSLYGLSELGAEGGAADHDRGRPRHRLSRQCLEHRRRGPAHHGRHRRRRRGARFWGETGWWILPLMCLAGILGGMAYAAIPAFLKTRFDVNEILTSLMLTYVADAVPQHAGLRALEGPGGLRLPADADVHRSAMLPVILRGHAAASRRADRARWSRSPPGC